MQLFLLSQQKTAWVKLEKGQKSVIRSPKVTIPTVSYSENKLPYELEITFHPLIFKELHLDSFKSEPFFLYSLEILGSS